MLRTLTLAVAAAAALAPAHAQLLSPQWPQEQRTRFLAMGKAQWSLGQTCNTMISFTKTLEADAFFANANGVPARVAMTNDFAAWAQDDARGLGAKHPGSVFNWSICKGNQVAATVFALPPATQTWTITPPTAPVSVLKTVDVNLGGDRTQHIVDVSLNGVGFYHFILDTGASACTIPQPVIDYLTAHGVLSAREYAGSENFKIADGSVHQSPQYRINLLEVGSGSNGAHLRDVTCSVTPAGSDGLLGMDFLGAFDSFAIDNAHNKLTLTWTLKA